MIPWNPGKSLLGKITTRSLETYAAKNSVFLNVYYIDQIIIINFDSQLEFFYNKL